MMGACSEQDNVLTEQPAEAPGVIYFSGTVSTNDGSTTRTTFTEGTNEEGKTIMNVAWKEDDLILLYQDGVLHGSAAVTSLNEDGSANINGSISVNNDEGGIYNLDKEFDLLYCGGFNQKSFMDEALLHQYSVLSNSGADITHYDYRKGSAKVKADPGNAGKYILDGRVKMISQMAIWRLTLKDGLKVSKYHWLKIQSDGADIAKTGGVDYFQGDETNVVYLAMYPVEDKTITILYTDGTNNYMFSKPGVTLKANTYYQSEVTLTKYTGTIQYLTSASESIELEDGNILTGKGGENTKVTIPDGASVTLHGVDITSINGKGWAGITCEGDATITLKGTNKVKGGDYEHPGILIPVGDDEYNPKTLTIEGDGKLEASGGSGAGIGGEFHYACGNIEINGGEIIAKSTNGAGIGGAQEGKSGTITISGGKVTAKSDGRSAGIGSGAGARCKGITITGGTVIATSQEHAAGIGGGEGSYNDSGDSGYGCDYISISGGTVTATGGENAPGIGAGAADGYKNATCGPITLSGDFSIPSGGTVTAIAGNGAPAAIGIGANHSDSRHTSTCWSIEITDEVTSVAMTNAAAGAPPKVGMFLNASSLTLFGHPFDLSLETSDVDATFFTNTYAPSTKTWTLEQKP